MAQNIADVGAVRVHKAWSRLMHSLVYKTRALSRKQARANARMRRASR